MGWSKVPDPLRYFSNSASRLTFSKARAAHRVKAPKARNKIAQGNALGSEHKDSFRSTPDGSASLFWQRVRAAIEAAQNILWGPVSQGGVASLLTLG